jgi:hypothetical protein
MPIGDLVIIEGYDGPQPERKNRIGDGLRRNDELPLVAGTALPRLYGVQR